MCKDTHALTRREAYLHVKKIEQTKHADVLKELVSNTDKLIEASVKEGAHGLLIEVDPLYIKLIKEHYTDKDFDVKMKDNTLYIRWYPL